MPGAAFCQITRAPCRSSIHARGHSATDVSNAARATTKFLRPDVSLVPMRGRLSWRPYRSGRFTLCRFDRAKATRGRVGSLRTPILCPHLTVDMSVAGTAVCRICLFGSILPKYHEPHFRVGQGRSFCRLSFPKILSGLDSRREAESSHHPGRCLQSCTRLECSSPTCSSRDVGLRPKTCFSVINSASP